MKTPKGRETIGEFNGIPLVIDWGDLLHYKGKLDVRMSADKILGRLLGGIGMIMMVASIAWIFLTADWAALGILPAASIYELIFWAGAGIFLYARYLLRDREKFEFNLEHKQLDKLLKNLNNAKEIEIDDVIVFPILVLIDKSFYVHNDSFVDDMIDYCLEHPHTKALLARLGVDAAQFTEKALEHAKQINTSWDLHYKGLFTAAFHKAAELHYKNINAVCFFFAFASHLWKELLQDFDVTEEDVLSIELWLRNENQKQRYLELWHQMAYLKPTGTVNRAYTSRFAPTLESFGEDYTRGAAAGIFELSMGREEEMEEILNILQRPDGIAGLLVGPAGVGKSHLLRNLAVKMVVEDVPPELRDKRLVVFDFTRAYSQSGSVDDFKLTLQTLFDEVEATKDVILVLDEIEQLLNVREDFKSEITNVLENGIRNRQLMVLATTTTDNYRRFLESDQALAALFQVVEMNEPDSKVSLQILIDETSKFEAEYKVSVEVHALKQIVKLAPQFEHEKVMPDKAIDLLEEALIEARNKGEQFLTEERVSEVVSRKVGVNVGTISQDEADKLMKLEDTLHERVVGQDAAVTAVATALRRARAGFNKGNQPIAAFLFFGPTGVGKTEVARTLAAQYYGNEKLMIRIDMSEYQEEENLGRLIGRMENGKFEGGYLTEAVRAKPYSLVLLDELEKANPRVLDLFLQMLDEGNLTDGAGRKVSFANTIIVATSNAGSREIAELIGKGQKYEEVSKQVTPILQKVYRVEFLNRFDRVIMFKPLSQIEVQEIARRMLTKVSKQMMEDGIELKMSEEAIKQLAELGYDPVYGARQLDRAIQEKVQDKIAELVVVGQLKSGKTIEFISLEKANVHE